MGNFINSDYNTNKLLYTKSNELLISPLDTNELLISNRNGESYNSFNFNSNIYPYELVKQNIPMHRAASIEHTKKLEKGYKNNYNKEYFTRQPYSYQKRYVQKCVCVNDKCKYTNYRQYYINPLYASKYNSNINNNTKHRSFCICPKCKYNKKEYFIDNVTEEKRIIDPRFLLGTSDIYTSFGSDVQNITRVYGTVAQKRKYPKYTDLIRHGYTTLTPEQIKNQSEIIKTSGFKVL